MEDSVKARVLRPLGQAFGQMARDIDAGKYPEDIPLEDAMMYCENYIDSAWDRLKVILEKEYGYTLE